MRLLQRGCNRFDDGHGFSRGQASLAGEPGGERLPVDQLHHDERTVAVLAVVEDAGHVGMREARGGSRLAAEPLDEPLILRQRFGQDLHRDPAMQDRVLGLPHRPHPAGSDPAHQPIPASQDHVAVDLGHAAYPPNAACRTALAIGAAT